MIPDLSLAHLTVISLAPPQMVDVAARTGYRYVGLRLIAVTPDSPGYPLMNDKTMMRETKARLADTGIGVHDIEFVRFASIGSYDGLSVGRDFRPRCERVLNRKGI